MSKSQWITAGIAVLIVLGLYAATQQNLFGPPKDKKKTAATTTASSPSPAYSSDSILFHAKEILTPDQATRLNLLEHSISRGDVKDQQLHVYHRLASFWRDTVRLEEPYAYYTAEAARLENSEKSLTFAAHLFLNKLKEERNEKVREWEVLQAEDLFERSLKINPLNDSSQVGLGATMLFGGIGTPMDAVKKIREVADRDTTNVFAQMTMGEASLESQQFDKALARFSRVARLQPDNLEAIFRAAEISEHLGNKKAAAGWYTKLLPHVNNAAMKKEVEARIAELNK
jgi:tetratricopeptide (TPR) repeat protein